MFRWLINHLFFLSLIVFPSLGFAVDIPPGQAIAPPPGKSAIRFEMNSVRFGDKYLAGKALNTRSELTFSLHYSGGLINSRQPGLSVQLGWLSRAAPSTP